MLWLRKNNNTELGWLSAVWFVLVFCACALPQLARRGTVGRAALHVRLFYFPISELRSYNLALLCSSPFVRQNATNQWNHHENASTNGMRSIDALVVAWQQQQRAYSTLDSDVPVCVDTGNLQLQPNGPRLPLFLILTVATQVPNGDFFQVFKHFPRDLWLPSSNYAAVYVSFKCNQVLQGASRNKAF